MAAASKPSSKKAAVTAKTAKKAGSTKSGAGKRTVSPKSTVPTSQLSASLQKHKAFVEHFAKLKMEPARTWFADVADACWAFAQKATKAQKLPEPTVALKWGMSTIMIQGRNALNIGGFNKHVTLFCGLPESRPSGLLKYDGVTSSKAGFQLQASMSKAAGGNGVPEKELQELMAFIVKRTSEKARTRASDHAKKPKKETRVKSAPSKPAAGKKLTSSKGKAAKKK
jgi:hypothetical protein